jgi:glycosyltransferase involved in cell wall biosynthesis
MNPRLIKEADTFSDAGYEVKVIAPDYSPWARQADAEFNDRKWRLVARPRFGPTADPLTRARELARRAAAITLTKGLDIRCAPLMRAAHHPAALALVQAASKVKADLYIAHRDIALPAAAKAAARHGSLYAFDAEDFHLGEAFAPQEQAYRQKLVRAFEAPYLRGCAYMTAASPGIAHAYAAEYCIPTPVVVLNLFSRARAPYEATAAGNATPGPSLYWYSQVIGPERGLECAVRAVGRARSRPHLYLRGAASPQFLIELETIAKREKASDRIHILPPAPPSALEELAAAYDIGLAGEPGVTANSAILLSNKLFSYLLAGLPVVLSNTPAQTAIAEQLGDAAQVFPAEDADALARALDRWFEHPQALAAARSAAWRLGQQRYNWEAERSVLLEVAERALAQRVVR